MGRSDGQQDQLGCPGGKRPASAKHPGDLDERRLVRHHFHRSPRDADLGQNGWLTSLNDVGDDAAYDLNDIFQLVRNGLLSESHNENRALFKDDKCATWVEAITAANDIRNPANSKIADVIDSSRHRSR